MRNILKNNPEQKKPVLVVYVDNGPDWSPRSPTHILYFGRLWEDENVDMLVVATYAPGFSRYNPIEHIWAPCSKALAGVSLDSILPGEDKGPCQQRLSDVDRNEKERVLFDNALEQLNGYWDNKVHDEYNFFSCAVYCAKDTPDHQNFYSDYETAKRLFSSSLKAVPEDPHLNALSDKMKFYLKHIDRHHGFVCFRRGSCGEAHCRCQLITITATEVWKLPQSNVWNLPPITKDLQHPGHYLTFKDMLKTTKFSQVDEHMSLATHGKFSKCRYVFTSVSDSERHQLLMHTGKRGVTTHLTVLHMCKVCKVTFDTR